MINNYIYNELYQCHHFLVWLYGKYFFPSNIIIQIIIFYELMNELIKVEIDNYPVYFLFSEINIHKRKKLYIML